MPCPYIIRLHHGPYREQPAGIEDHRVEAGTQRYERGRHPPVKRRRVPVEVPDLDALMDQVVVVGPCVRVVRPGKMGPPVGPKAAPRASGGNTWRSITARLKLGAYSLRMSKQRSANRSFSWSQLPFRSR